MNQMRGNSSADIFYINFSDSYYIHSKYKTKILKILNIRIIKILTDLFSPMLSGQYGSVAQVSVRSVWFSVGLLKKELFVLLW